MRCSSRLVGGSDSRHSRGTVTWQSSGERDHTGSSGGAGSAVAAGATPGADAPGGALCPVRRRDTPALARHVDVLGQPAAAAAAGTGDSNGDPDARHGGAPPPRDGQPGPDRGWVLTRVGGGGRARLL